MDGFATLDSPDRYEKTYQDEMDVPKLVDGFSQSRPLNIDKLFVDQGLIARRRESADAFVSQPPLRKGVCQDEIFER